MTYDDLTKILLSTFVYENIKLNEKAIFELIPELKACKGFNQNNKWHIYDVYEHILHVVNWTNTDKCLRIAALFHDIGKPLVYTEDSDKIGHFYNHWNASIDIFKKYVDKFKLTNDEISLIINLIFYHDMNLEKVSIKDMGSKNNLKLLYSLKRSDLLAQSSEYHYLISQINNHEKSLL